MKVLLSLCRWLILLGIIGALAGCGGPEPALSGVVTDAYTNAPLANITVAVGEATAQTGADGRYRLSAWSPEAQLSASLDGYDPYTLDLKTRPELAKAATDQQIDIVLRPNVVSGLVTDVYKSQPLAGVQVKAGDALVATTGNDGRYSIKGVPEQFKLEASLADHDPASADLTRATSHDFQLRPNILAGQITDKYTGAPVVGITVSSGDSQATTDAEGRYILKNIQPNATVVISGTDYDEQSLQAPAGISLNAILRPSAVQGSVTDVQSGTPISDAVVLAMVAPAPNLDQSQPYTGTAVSMAHTGADGRYKLQDVPEGAQIQVLMPGYKKGIATFTEGDFKSDIKLEPFISKAIYITAATASSRDAMIELFDLVDQTELNTVIIDVKLDIVGMVGNVGYLSQTPYVQELGTAVDWIDMAWIAQEARRRGIYTVGRMPIMRDDNLVRAKPEWGVQSTRGGLWADHGGLHWLDPFRPEVMEYNLGLVREIAAFGWDEVQFDYIRFPSDGNVELMRFTQPIDRVNNPEPMYETIARLLEASHEMANSNGMFLSIDVFGYATWRDMWEIGQKLEYMAPHSDYIYPMVYPSHYDYNELGLGNPDEHPYEIVYDSVRRGLPRIEGRRALFRPWLQAFTASWLYDGEPVRYNRQMIREQIRATNDLNTNGWALWNAANSYDPNWLDKE